MLFSRTAVLIFTLLALLSTFTFISAQQTQAPSEACTQCLLAAKIRQVPSCEGITTTTTRASNSNSKTPMTPQEKSCHCGAANSDAWIQSCAKPDLCNNLTLNIVRSAYGPIKMACDAAGISASGAGGALTSKTAVTGVAVVAAALGVLL